MARPSARSLRDPVPPALAAILAAAALCGCGSVDRRTPVGRGQLGVASAIRTEGWLRTALSEPPPAPARTPRPEAPRAPARRTRPEPPPAPPRPTWRIDPDAPLPRTSRWWPVLAVARRFAVADMSYEVGELGPAVRRAITTTCTGAFAAGLFAHRAILPPGVNPRQVSQRLVGVAALHRVGGSAVVLATVRSNGRGGAPAAFELRLVPRPGGWRVAGLSVV